MNVRIVFIVIMIAATMGGFTLYKKFLSAPIDEKKICIISVNTPGVKDDIRFIRQALQLYDIKRSQIIETKNLNCENAIIKVILDQKKFDECIKKNDSSLKVGVHTHNYSEEDPKTINVLEEDNTQLLFELIGTVVKGPVSCLLIYEEGDEYSRNSAMQFQELFKIKEIKLHLCALSANRNVSTVLKETSQDINAVIFIPGQLVFRDSELMLEHFKAKKIPVFANHAGLVRIGALGGYDFDSQEIAHGIAEITYAFLRDEKNIKNDAFDELYSQLHLNMDTIDHLNIQLDSDDLLDEAVTVGGADL